MDIKTMKMNYFIQPIFNSLVIKSHFLALKILKNRRIGTFRLIFEFLRQKLLVSIRKIENIPVPNCKNGTNVASYGSYVAVGPKILNFCDY